MCAVPSSAGRKAARPRLLFFYSERDGSARRAEGHLAQVLQRRKNHETFVVHRIEIAERPDLAKRFKISQAPALVVVGDKQVLGRLERPRNAIEIQGLLSPWLR